MPAEILARANPPPLAVPPPLLFEVLAAVYTLLSKSSCMPLSAAFLWMVSETRSLGFHQFNTYHYCSDAQDPSTTTDCVNKSNYPERYEVHGARRALDAKRMMGATGIPSLLLRSTGE